MGRLQRQLGVGGWSAALEIALKEVWLRISIGAQTEPPPRASGAFPFFSSTAVEPMRLTGRRSSFACASG